MYPPGTPVDAIPIETNVPVVAESYDEVVFTEPTEKFFRQLQRLSSAPPIEYSQQNHFQQFSDTEDVHALLEAQKFLQSELTHVKERLRLAEADLAQVDEDLRHAQETRKTSVSNRKNPAVVARTTTAGTTAKKQKTVSQVFYKPHLN